MDRLENEMLRGDRSVESYLAGMLGEMEREWRANGLNDAQVEVELEIARRKLAALVPVGELAGAVCGQPERDDAAPEGAEVLDPPNRGPP